MGPGRPTVGACGPQGTAAPTIGLKALFSPSASCIVEPHYAIWVGRRGADLLHFPVADSSCPYVETDPLRRGVGRGNVPGKCIVRVIFGTVRGRLKISGRLRTNSGLELWRGNLL